MAAASRAEGGQVEPVLGGCNQSPIVAAVDTRFSMNANHFTAFWTLPSFLLLFNKAIKSKLSDVFKVFDGAHSVFRSVSVIYLSKSSAGKLGTIKAVFLFEGRHLITILDSTYPTVLRFIGIVALASRTRLLLSEVGDTKTAVHPTGRNQHCIERINMLLFFCIQGYCLC